VKPIRWLVIFVAVAISVALAITTTLFRFQNPTLTETQLLQRCVLEYVLMGAMAFVVAILISPRDSTTVLVAKKWSRNNRGSEGAIGRPHHSSTTAMISS